MASDPRALMQKAEKTLQSASGGFSFFGGREEKYQDASDTFLLAANAFRLNKQLIEAGKAFEKAAEVQSKNLNDLDDAANTLVDAFKAYRIDDPRSAARCLENAIQRYCAKGNFRRAATHKENLGEVYETGLKDTKAAMENYEQAAEWLEGDNAYALGNKLWLKSADIAAIQGDYLHAVKNYERVAEWSVNNNMMRYSVKEYLLKAGLCNLALDLVSAERSLDKYREIDPSFPKEREAALLFDLVDAVKDQDQDAFTDKLFRYDQVSKLDKWKTDMCLRIKNKIVKKEPEAEAEEEGFEDFA